MKKPIYEAMEIVQKIIPEVNLEIEDVDGKVYVRSAPFVDWALYIVAMENASDLLLKEISSLPDVDVVTEIEAIAQDLSCLIATFSFFYEITAREMIKELKERKKTLKTEDVALTRFSKYRAKINREEGEMR